MVQKCWADMTASEKEAEAIRVDQERRREEDEHVAFVSAVREMGEVGEDERVRLRKGRRFLRQFLNADQIQEDAINQPVTVGDYCYRAVFTDDKAVNVDPMREMIWCGRPLVYDCNGARTVVDATGFRADGDHVDEVVREAVRAIKEWIAEFDSYL